MKIAIRLTLLVLAVVGGYTLWTKYGQQIDALIGGDSTDPGARRVMERSELNAEEQAAGSADPVAQAAAILTESEERTRLPRTADGIERRRSEDTVEP